MMNAEILAGARRRLREARERIAKLEAEIDRLKAVCIDCPSLCRARKRIAELEGKMLGMVSEAYLSEQLQYGANCIAIRDTQIERLKGELAELEAENETLRTELLEYLRVDLSVAPNWAREKIEQRIAKLEEKDGEG